MRIERPGMFLNKMDKRRNNSDNQSKKQTIFHLTHYKAGSQWVREVLTSAVSNRIVKPLPRVEHITAQPIIEGLVYPCVYLTRDEFFSLELPESYRSFYIIRDLRDSLISQYFSLRYSHKISQKNMQKARERLSSMGFKEGLLSMMTKRWSLAEIQRSWTHPGETLKVKFEDLRKDQFCNFKKIFTHCDIAITDDNLKTIINAHTFEKKTGRKPGQEDVKSHHRKGIVGDWKNYFDAGLKREFKKMYGDVLISTGYETDMNW